MADEPAAGADDAPGEAEADASDDEPSEEAEADASDETGGAAGGSVVPPSEASDDPLGDAEDALAGTDAPAEGAEVADVPWVDVEDACGVDDDTWYVWSENDEPVGFAVADVFFDESGYSALLTLTDEGYAFDVDAIYAEYGDDPILYFADETGAIFEYQFTDEACDEADGGAVPMSDAVLPGETATISADVAAPVAVPAQPAAPTPAAAQVAVPELASTGFSSGAAAWFAGALVVAGAALLALRTRVARQP
ncbi:hypothetical protein [Paraoerskovia sediminicola]|uniref:hypothetical protein n=1 Tax=Paraoerskovia sediminicola TaxID=1138587 RepID=UPI00257357A4|nr:hypothetical protein [Paraoerskovia sediminicola]